MDDHMSLEKYIGTGKAECKECRKKIAKDDLGVAVLGYGRHYPVDSKYHLDCYKKMISKEIEDALKR